MAELMNSPVITWLQVNDSAQTSVAVCGRTLIAIVQKVSLLYPPYTVAIGEKHTGVFNGFERFETCDAAKIHAGNTLMAMAKHIRAAQGKAGVA